MIWYFVSFSIGIIPGIFLGILLAKRYPATGKWCSASGQAAMQAGEVDARLAGKSLPQVHAVTKYALRFGVPLVGAIGLIALLKANTISVVLYKCCLILTGFILAETIWVVGYKYIFGKIEKEGIGEYDRRSIMLFRGMLYAAIILGLTAGL